tara:strand:+ start:678 stop:956 length:279 start_codon:yes stop_codon:yes gene_type:complete
MSKRTKGKLSDIRLIILAQYPLFAAEYGNCFFDGDGVARDIEEAYVWYQVALCAGDNQVGGLVDYIGSTLAKSKRRRLSSRAKNIYVRALQC